MIARFQACYLPILSAFAPKADVRYYLNGLYVEPAAAGGVYLVATDGHALVVIHDEKGEAARPAIFPIPRLLLRQCGSRSKKILPADKFVEFDGRMARVTAGADYFEHDVAVGCKEIEGKYPDYRKVMREQPDAEVAPSFFADPVLMARLEVLKKLQPRYVAVRYSARRSGTILCTPNLAFHKVFVVVMQMRDYAVNDTPEWLGELLAPPAPPKVEINEATAYECAVDAEAAVMGGGVAHG